jgi:hypothetical protein
VASSEIFNLQVGKKPRSLALDRDNIIKAGEEIQERRSRKKMCMDRGAAVPVKRIWLSIAARVGLRGKTGTLLPSSIECVCRRRR